MKVFTTNWYLYKTHFHTNSIESPIQKLRTGNDVYPSREKTNVSTENEAKCKKISFEELLLEAIDEGLYSLGKSAKQVIYFHLEKTFKVKRQDIPSQIEKFTYAIEQIFGTGAKILEINIMKCLFKKVGCTLENYQKKTNLEFIDYVETARAQASKK
jgi:hypothetical protein